MFGGTIYATVDVVLIHRMDVPFIYTNNSIWDDANIATTTKQQKGLLFVTCGTSDMDSRTTQCTECTKYTGTKHTRAGVSARVYDHPEHEHMLSKIYYY